MTSKLVRFAMALAMTCGVGILGVPRICAQARPEVIELNLDQAVQPVSAESVSYTHLTLPTILLV